MSVLEVFQQYTEQVNDACEVTSCHYDGHADYSNNDEHRDWHTDCR